MKKPLLLVGLLLLLAVVTYAQKVDLDEFTITPSYIQLPSNPLPTELTTYSNSFAPVGFSLQQLGYSADDLRSTYFSISGFRKVDKGGHFTIKVQIDLPQVEEIKEVTKVVTEKGKDGKETKRTTYAYSFKYYVPIRYVMTDYQQNILQEGAIADGTRVQVHYTDYFATQTQSQENWKRNRDAILTERSRSHMSQTLSGFQSRLNSDFGYVTRSKQTDKLWILNSSKHPEFDAYQKNYQLVKAAFDQMSPESGLDAPALKPVMAYLESLLTKYPADEKADRKLRYSAYYNLGWIYYWLDDMDKALLNADLLIKNDYDKRDGELLKETINATESRLAANRMTTRHLVRDLSKATPPAEPAALVAQREAEAADAKVKKQAELMGQLATVKEKIDDLVESMKKREEQRKLEIKTYDSLLVKEPKNDKYYYTRGKLKQSIGDGAGAVADLEKAVGLLPKNLTYIDNLGRIALWAGAYDKSIAAFDQALTLSPKNADLVFQKGVALSRATRYAEAITVLDQAHLLNPKSVDILNERGFAHDYLWQYEAALQDFTKAAKLNPKNAESRFGIGFIKANTGHYEEALPDFAESLKLDSSQPRVYGNRAFALGNLGRMEEAKKDAETALTRNKNYANGYYIRAWLRIREKNYQGALEDARKALSLIHPKPYKVHAIMGDAMLGLGIASEAIKLYDEALRIRPDFAEAAAGKQKASELAAK